jgi:hypothetical protein
VRSLEERLVLFSPRFRPGVPRRYAVAPAYEELVRERTPLSLLFPLPSPAAPLPTPRGEHLSVSPAFLGAFLSFAAANNDLCKANGGLKKRAAAKFFKVFPELFGEMRRGKDTPPLLDIFISALAKLGLLRHQENDDAGEWLCDFAAWKHFALLPQEQRLALIATAACDGTRKSHINDLAHFFLAFIHLLPDAGFAEFVFLNAESFYFKRFFSEREQKRLRLFGSFLDIQDILEDFLHHAAAFGLLEARIPETQGKEASGDAVYGRCQGVFPAEQAGKQGISVDSAHTVTVLPTVPLADLVRLARFSDLAAFDTVVRYEITKNSAVRGFDQGCTPQSILADLSELCAHELPQSMSFTLEDWYQMYRSVTLYRGYVLHINDEHVQRMLQHPAIAPRIDREIAPGVYLLRGGTDADIRRLMEKQLGRALGKIHTASDTSGSPYPRGTLGIFTPAKVEGRGGAIDFSQEDAPVADNHAAKAFLKSLVKELDAMDLPKEQQEELEQRIQRRIVVNLAQIKAGSVAYEKTEAGYMDFQGKIRLLDFAVNNHTPVALRMHSGGAQDTDIIGYPLALRRRAQDIQVIIRAEPDHSLQSYPVGKLQSVRKIRAFLFDPAPDEGV